MLCPPPHKLGSKLCQESISKFSAPKIGHLSAPPVPCRLGGNQDYRVVTLNNLRFSHYCSYYLVAFNGISLSDDLSSFYSTQIYRIFGLNIPPNILFLGVKLSNIRIEYSRQAQKFEHTYLRRIFGGNIKVKYESCWEILS